MGRLEEAKEAYDRVVERTPLRTWEAADIWVVPYLVAAGRREEAERTLAYWEAQVPLKKVDPYNVATMQAALGRTSQALDSLELAYRQHSVGMIFLKCENLLDPIRHHPRYLAILKKMNFPE